MNKLWSDIAWDEYLQWQAEDKKAIKKINALIKDIERNGVGTGLGKTERLRCIYGWSREIDKKNRLVYRIENGALWIASCKGHYED
ncbi:MAG: Txe/YoeB family addiction module toxin [Pyramidobacter sp.]|jgi:toxin YoeB